jgi:cyclopropane fatty-acyl-phospholipid synthase-like methyltransferase
MRTAQELFDTVAAHLRTQQEKSVVMDPQNTKEYYCRYFSPTGLKCAIGCLIPDAVYKAQMEEKTLPLMLAYNLLPTDLQEEFRHHENLLVELQFIHDQREIKNWERYLAACAARFNLIYIEQGA